MPSFDIVSEVNSMEIENAVNIAKKELANRFDFKGSKAEIVLEKNEIIIIDFAVMDEVHGINGTLY